MELKDFFLMSERKIFEELLIQFMSFFLVLN